MGVRLGLLLLLQGNSRPAGPSSAPSNLHPHSPLALPVLDADSGHHYPHARRYLHHAYLSSSVSLGVEGLRGSGYRDRAGGCSSTCLPSMVFDTGPQVGRALGSRSAWPHPHTLTPVARSLRGRLFRRGPFCRPSPRARVGGVTNPIMPGADWQAGVGRSTAGWAHRGSGLDLRIS